MKIKESEALAIAKQLIMDEYKESNFSINEKEYKIRLDKGGFGQTFFGLENYWSVTFILKSTELDVGIFDSEYIVIFVDAESGEPNWFPAM
ncbi:MAG: hypothetical protein IEMM0001_0813 [bacterium]|nr:MAG: hypothetical protein IEMM0001_0813 [bacterium]